METEYFGLLIGVAFLAGVVDSIAGGGGLLTMPALLFAGIPPTQAIGTTKFFAACGSSVSVWNFARRKLIRWQLVLLGFGFTLVGGFLGSKAILWLDPEWVRTLILVFLPLAAFSLFIKQQDTRERPVEHEKPKVGSLAFGLGFYDGFFGPGTGTFLALGFHQLLGLNLVHATALAKPFNLISNLVALATFAFYGKVIWAIGFPMAVSNMLGNWAGSHLTMRQGASLVRRALLAVFVLLFVSLVLGRLRSC